MSVYIQLKNNKYIEISNLKHITYPDDNGDTITIKDFENFHLYNKLLTFVGEKSIISIDSKNIEYLQFNSTNS